MRCGTNHINHYTAPAALSRLNHPALKICCAFDPRPAVLRHLSLMYYFVSFINRCGSSFTTSYETFDEQKNAVGCGEE